jgi:hypothetical protein
MIDISLLLPAELSEVWHWFEAEGIESWESYRDRLTGPQWMHLGLFDGAQLVGCISCEKMADTCFYHVSTKRGAVKPKDLRHALIESTRLFLASGMSQSSAVIPHKNRAAKLLAISCGMKLRGGDEKEGIYTITAEEFIQRWGDYGRKSEAAVSEHDDQHV